MEILFHETITSSPIFKDSIELLTNVLDQKSFLFLVNGYLFCFKVIYCGRCRIYFNFGLLDDSCRFHLGDGGGGGVA